MAGLMPPLFAQDSMAPAQIPPAGLAVEDVPQFVMIGFDDNPEVDSMAWIVDFLADKRNPAGTDQAATFDGGPARVAFYSNGKYLDPSRKLRELHLRAWDEGHEIGNHTYNHDHGAEFTVEEWKQALGRNRQALLKAQIPEAAQQGYRTPFLAYNAATFEALADRGFVYDSSIEEGYQADQDGTNFYWPYTLDEGSPGNQLAVEWGSKELIARHPGLWEIALHVFMVPDDKTCERYGVPAGMRNRVREGMQAGGWEWSVEPGKITGLDWNVFEQARLSGGDFLAILKYTLDLRLAGNRAPLMVGAHTQLFPESEPVRRAAMEVFIRYALSKPAVRLVTPQQTLQWLRDPVVLGE